MGAGPATAPIVANAIRPTANASIASFISSSRFLQAMALARAHRVAQRTDLLITVGRHVSGPWLVGLGPDARCLKCWPQPWRMVFRVLSKCSTDRSRSSPYQRPLRGQCVRLQETAMLISDVLRTKGHNVVKIRA